MTKERAVVTVEDCFHGLKQASEKLGTGLERRISGVGPDVFSIIYGTTQVVP
jgi:hypothetical protein